MTLGKSKEESGNGKAVPLNAVRTGKNVEAFLGKGSKVVGTLNFSGPVELDGYIEGELHSQELLTIGEAAVIKAKVVGSEILVKGTVNGDIVASKSLCLRRPAKVVGNITSSKLSIEEGVVFEGTCSMDSSAVKKDSTTLAEAKKLEASA